MITIPTLQSIYNSVLNDLQTNYGVTISPVGKNVLRVFAAVHSAKLKLLYLGLGNVQKNIFVDTADPEALGGTLERFGRVKLGRNPYKAVAGIYEIIVTGDIGATIPAQTTFKSDDDALSPGILYVLDAAYQLQNTSDTIEVRALTPGLEGKLNSGDTLTATAPIAQVDSGAEVYIESTEPLAAEELEDYREAILNAFRLEPKGGAATDYILWAQDAQGVQTVYPYAKSATPAEIVIYVEATLVDSTDNKGTPSPALLNAVEQVIEYDPDTTLPVLERGRRPLGVFNIDFLPVIIKEIDIEIVNWTNTSGPSLTAVTTALRARIASMRPYVAAAYPIDQKDDIIDKNKIIAVIVEEEPTANFSDVNLYVNNVLLTSYQFINGNIPYLDTVINV